MPHMMRAVNAYCDLAGLPRPTAEQAAEIRKELIGEEAAKNKDIYLSIAPVPKLDADVEKAIIELGNTMELKSGPAEKQ